MPDTNCCQARAAVTLEVASEVVAPFWSDSWKICPAFALRFACTVRLASAAFVRNCPFGSVSWSTVTLYCPAAGTLTDQRPASVVVEVAVKPPGPATSTSTPEAGSRLESRIVPWMHPFVVLTVQGWVLDGASRRRCGRRCRGRRARTDRRSADRPVDQEGRQEGRDEHDDEHQSATTWRTGAEPAQQRRPRRSDGSHGRASRSDVEEPMAHLCRGCFRNVPCVIRTETVTMWRKASAGVGTSLPTGPIPWGSSRNAQRDARVSMVHPEPDAASGVADHFTSPTKGTHGPAGSVRIHRTHVRRRHAPAGAHRRHPERGVHRVPAHQADLGQRAAALGRDGHRHRVPHGHRHGATGRHRDPAPQPLHRGPGRLRRQGQAVRVGHDHQPGHHHAGRHRGRGRRRSAASSASPACPSSRRTAPWSASSPTATCASSRRSSSRPRSCATS